MADEQDLITFPKVASRDRRPPPSYPYWTLTPSTEWEVVAAVGSSHRRPVVQNRPSIPTAAFKIKVRFFHSKLISR